MAEGFFCSVLDGLGEPSRAPHANGEKATSGGAARRAQKNIVEACL
jgi:hypothetical protein